MSSDGSILLFSQDDIEHSFEPEAVPLRPSEEDSLLRSDNEDESVSSDKSLDDSEPAEDNFWDTTWLNATFKKQNGCGKLAPPANWRTNDQKVREWRRLSRSDQESEVSRFKALPLKDRKRLDRSVTGVKHKRNREFPRRSSRIRQRNVGASESASISTPPAQPAVDTFTHHGMASPSREENLISQSRHNSFRKLGSRPPTVQAQNDAVAQKSERRLLKEVASHIKTVNYVTKSEIPRCHVLLVLVKEVRESRAYGGKVPASEFKMQEPDIQIISNSRKSCKRALSRASQVIHNRSENNIFYDDINIDIQISIGKAIQDKKDKRSRPKQGHSSVVNLFNDMHDTVVDEVITSP